jgi:hypothetical protein
LEELSELGGVLPCEYLEEPGVGSGVPGKIGKDLSRHPNSFDFGSDCCEAAAIMGFGTATEVTGRLRRELAIEVEDPCLI